MSRNDILESALNLPINERIVLVETLLESYNSFEDENIEKEWEEEAKVRAKFLKKGELETISYDEFFDEN